MKTWNKSTNAYVIPVSGAVNITERWYYKDPVTKLFCSYTNISITFSSSVWVTNYTPSWPVKIAEAPISFHGKIFYAGTNGVSESREGDVVYKIDNSRNTGRNYWIMFNFRIAPAGEDTYLKYYTQVSAGAVVSWQPSLTQARTLIPGVIWMQKVGYAQKETYPYGVKDAIIENPVMGNSNQVPLN
jgi:hypothetical protein